MRSEDISSKMMFLFLLVWIVLKEKINNVYTMVQVEVN